MNTDLAAKLGRFVALCRQRNLRLTHQRMEIFREIARDSSHPSVEEIYQRIHRRLPTLSLDTVYRTISTFEEFGIVKRVQILDDRGRFDSNTESHHHLVCKRCKRVDDFYWPDFDQIEFPNVLKSWGRLNSKHAEIRGFCKDCLRQMGEK